MSGATFLAGIVLSLALGTVLGGGIVALWLSAHRREIPPDVLKDVPPDVPKEPPVFDQLQRLESQIRDFESQRQRMLGGLDTSLRL